MGRKPSNVYDYFTRLDPLDGKGLARYECKKCNKQYASNATRLADHLKTSGCFPSFQSNQRALMLTSPPAPVSLSGAYAHAQATQPDLHLDPDMPLDTDLLLRLAKLSTCVIADALADLRIQGHLVDVELIRGYDNPLAINICGPALTVKVMPSGGPSVKKLPFNYVDSAEMGQVIVVSAPEGATNAIFGGLYATGSKARSVAGVVTDGRVRDVQEITSLGFPAFSKGTSVHGQRKATTVVDVGCPVVVSGCVVRNADIIRGDINGVIVIPLERANEVALKAELIEEQDNKIAHAVQQGEPLQRSFERFRSKNV